MKTLPNRPAFRMIRQLLAEGREVSVRVEGESMLPFFRSGQYVSLQAKIGESLVSRPYSIVSTPQQALQNKLVLAVIIPCRNSPVESA